jgi:hypothetical protein
MRSIKTFSLAVVAVVAFSAVAAAGASAEEFVASKAGKLSGKAVNTQEFKTGTGATATCTEVKPGGEIVSLKTTELAPTFAYSGCRISGIGSASVGLADFTFILPFLGTILDDIAFKASVLGVKCTFQVDDQTFGGSSGEGRYINKSGKIEIEMKVTKLADEVTESNSKALCGEAGEKKEGTYTGDVELELEGGTLEVK